MDRAAAVAIVRHEAGVRRTDQDLVVMEAPLGVDLRSSAGGPVRRLGMLMRTPGDDRELVSGWLFTEGVVRDLEQIYSIDHSTTESAESVETSVTVTLDASVDLDQLVQHWALTPTSACGLCGRLSLDRLDLGRTARDGRRWGSALIGRLPAVLQADQTVFAKTGGLHAAGLFDDAGALQFVREDIGRHNAVDKVIGAALLARALDGVCALLVVSGRAAFEIVQKAAMAKLRAVVAVGAPSDLAIQAARTAGLTLVGFARQGRFNVYSGEDRIDEDRVPANGLHSPRPQ